MVVQLNHVPYDTHWHGYIIRLSHVVCSHLFANLSAEYIKITNNKPM